MQNKLHAILADKFRLDQTRIFVLLIGVYCLLHFPLRIVFSPVLAADDVTQAIYAQTLDLGYETRQPPLFTWLQWGLNQLFGIGVHTHALLKYGLLFLTYLFLYLSGRIVFTDSKTAALATVSLWLTFPFAVSIHQGVTHSILLSALIAISLHAFLRLEQKRTWQAYLLFGFWAGLGMFSKYGYVVFFVALMLSAFTLPRFRCVLLDKRMFLSAIVMVLIAIPPIIWLIQHLEAVYQAANLLGPNTHAAATAKSWNPLPYLGSLLSAAVQFLLPLLIFLIVFYPKAFSRQAGKPLGDHARLLGRTILICFLIVTTAILVGLMGKIHARWMHTLLLLFPLYFFTRAEAAYPDGLFKKAYIGVLALVPILFLTLWAAQTYALPHVRKATRFHAPYDLLAKDLLEQQPVPSLIIAGDEYLAGNLRVGIKHAAVITPGFFYRPAIPESGSCLLIWQSVPGKPVAPAILPFIADSGVTAPENIRHWRHAYRYSDRTFLEVDYLYLPIRACSYSVLVLDGAAEGVE